METGKPTFGKERVRHAGSISILLPQAAHSSQIITYKSSQPGIQSNTWTVLVILFQYERDTNSQILKTIGESDPPVKLCVFDINKLFCLYSKAFSWLLMSLLVINTLFAITWRHVTRRPWPKRDPFGFWWGWLDGCITLLVRLNQFKLHCVFLVLYLKAMLHTRGIHLSWNSFCFNVTLLCVPAKGFPKCRVAVSHLSAVPADPGSFYWYVWTHIYGLVAGDQNSDPDTVVNSAGPHRFYSASLS